jgi:hypothetical protein
MRFAFRQQLRSGRTAVNFRILQAFEERRLVVANWPVLYKIVPGNATILVYFFRS